MPIYEYKCQDCGCIQEELMLVPVTPRRCEECAGKMKIQISRNTFQLKGVGWTPRFGKD